MLNFEFLALMAGLASAASWGVGDFSGGLASRRNDAITVVLVSQIVGLVILLLVAISVGQPVPPAMDLLAAALAGVLGTIGLVRFYRELSLGRMAIVAPLTAVVTVTIPVLFSAITEGLAEPIQGVGIALAILAIWLITRSGGRTVVSKRDLGSILLMGVLFSIFLITIGTVSERSVVWPLVTSRSASIALLSVAVFLTRRGSFSVPRNQLPIMSLIGVLDIGGSGLYAIASSLGRLDVAAVLASLYPAVTVLLARFFLSEQLGRAQWAGVVAALSAIVLITFG